MEYLAEKSEGYDSVSGLNCLPSKLPIRNYPLAAVITHFIFFLFPSKATWKKSGHSAPPSIVISCICFHDFRSSDVNNPNLFPSRNRAIIHFLPGSYHTTFGSRLSPMTFGSTGLPLYFVQVLPLF